MTDLVRIGGVPRSLNAWRRSPIKMRGVKPTIDLSAIPSTPTIEGFPTDYDQLALSSCGPNALGEVYEYQRGAKFSRLFAYYFTRATENDAWVDGGVTIPDLVAVAHTMGLPLETLCPYDIAAYQAPPSLNAVVSAVANRVERSDVIVDVDHMLFEINRGQPILFGFGVPASMQGSECARTGLVAVPSSGDPVIGGHAVVAFAADRAKRLIKCTCHYGPDFGDGGAIWLPYEHFDTGNATDLTAIRAPGFTG